MISTVTTTVSTIVSSSATISVLASLSLAGALTLLASLVTKELATGEGLRLRFLHRSVDVIILPLIFVFSFVVFMKIWDILAT